MPRKAQTAAHSATAAPTATGATTGGVATLERPATQAATGAGAAQRVIWQPGPDYRLVTANNVLGFNNQILRAGVFANADFMPLAYQRVLMLQMGWISPTPISAGISSGNGSGGVVRRGPRAKTATASRV